MASRTVRSRNSGTSVKEDKVFTCPECGGNEKFLDAEKGDEICATCGLVVEDHRIDTGPDWRAFTQQESDARARTGAPASFTMHDKGLSTVIDWRDTDSSGKQFSAKQRAQIHRLRKWQLRSRVHSSIDRNLAQAMTELDRLASQMGLSRGLKEQAAMIYRKLIVKRLVRSRSIDATVAAAVYAACRLRLAPRSLEEISQFSRVDKKKIGKHYRMIVERLKIRMPISEPSTYVPRLVTQLGVPGEVQRVTLEIIEKAKAKPGLITGRDPRGLAAAAIYIASILTDYRVTQRQIAIAAGVTEVTIRNRYKELVRELDIRMDPV